MSSAGVKSMRLRAAVLAAFITLAFAAPSRASDVGDFLGRRVVRVEVVIEGAPGSSTSEMQALLEVAAGQDYSPIRIRDSLVRLYRSGLISGARVEGEPIGADGVIIRFIVKPQARIEAIVFEGEAVFGTGILRARLNELDVGERLSAGAVSRGLDALLAFYSARGYYQARITSDIRLDDSGTRATVAYVIEPGQQARVADYALNVTGERIDLSKLKPAIAEGQPFTQQAVQEQMEQIRRAYLAQDYLAVRVTNTITPDPANNAVNVAINVESGPRVQVEVQGLELSEERKREILPFYEQGGVDDFTLEEGRRRLQDYAQRRGYFFAEVTKPNPPDLALPTARLDYVVDTGRRYKLTDIDIQGMDAIPSQTLQDQLKSKEASFIPFFGLGRGVTSNDMLRQDANTILRQLRDAGYRKAQVEVLRGVSVTGESLIITFHVTQGPRTHVEQVGIRGNNVLTTEELEQRLEMKPEAPLVVTDVTQDVDRLLTEYTSRGYADAEVLFDVVDLGSVDGQDRVRLIYRITEGNRVRIRQVTTRGTAITDTGRLERNFYEFKEGEWLRADLLQDTERVLYDTNAFTSVTITAETVGQTANGVEERDVTVNLLEAKRNLLIYGFGYQSSKSQLTVPGLSFLNGARGLVQLTNTNLFGKLYTGSTQLRVSQDELLGQVSFLNPRPFGTEYATLISVFARRLAEKTFRSDRYTALIQAERRFTNDTIVYLTYNFERISVYDLQGSEEEIERNRRPIRLGRIGPSFARDTRDNHFDPTGGTLTLGSIYLASSFLGGNEQFVKMLAEHSRYYTVPRFRDTVYSVSGRLGLASPFGGRDTLPISERFFGGGSRDLRGFGFEEAGPSESVVVNRETGERRVVPVGGNAVLVINNELRFPIWGFLGGSVFADTGNVFRRVRDIKPGNLTQTLGFGFRIKTPIGPIRLDFGFLVLNKPDGVRGFQRHLSFGSTF
jgi:outer membrane protein insertion porin family